MTKRPPSAAAPPVSKIGWSGAPNRDVAASSAPKPQADQGRADTRSKTSTYFTKADGETHIIYTGERMWAKITLVLETAGPVAVGTDQKLTPVTSGIGTLLVTNQEFVITIARGTRLYVAAESVNRIRLQIEPLPWMEQIVASLRELAGKALGR